MFQSIILMQVLHIFYQFSCSSLNPLDQLDIFSKCGFHTEQQYSKCGLTKLLYKGINVDCDLSVQEAQLSLTNRAMLVCKVVEV